MRGTRRVRMLPAMRDRANPRARSLPGGRRGGQCAYGTNARDRGALRTAHGALRRRAPIAQRGFADRGRARRRPYRARADSRRSTPGRFARRAARALSVLRRRTQSRANRASARSSANAASTRNSSRPFCCTHIRVRRGMRVRGLRARTNGRTRNCSCVWANRPHRSSRANSGANVPRCRPIYGWSSKKRAPCTCSSRRGCISGAVAALALALFSLGMPPRRVTCALAIACRLGFRAMERRAATGDARRGYGDGRTHGTRVRTRGAILELARDRRGVRRARSAGKRRDGFVRAFVFVRRRDLRGREAARAPDALR